MTTEHPFFFTWTSQNDAREVQVTGGSGAHFDTADGARWLDLGSLSYNAHLGHGHPDIVAAIQRQAETMCLTTANAVYPAKTELARRLLELAPRGFSRVFFTTGGAEANENAIKIARLVTGRYKLVSRYRSYHGATMGAVSLTGDWRRPLVEPGIIGAIHALDCYCDRCPFGQTPGQCQIECARHIGDVLRLEGRGSVAAVILEPVPGANGVLVPPPEYWPRVRQACDDDGALLIADEVLTGFGRTGRCFAVEHWNVVPDLITVAKGITAGYGTLGAVLVHERVAAHFDDNLLACGLTGYAHPLACAAGVAALDVYARGELYTRAARLEPLMMQPLHELRAALPGRVTAVRGLGLLGAIEVNGDAGEWRRFNDELRARHIFLHVYPERGTVVFAPPLVIAEDTLQGGMARVIEAFHAAFGG